MSRLYQTKLTKLQPHSYRLHANGGRNGRLSSNNPNLQNIPIRTERGRQIRKFVARDENYTLVSADYSQILRVIAALSVKKT
jgi:DNA polymerase I-like protein with 3'-5' exonuclease and polymerase domains